MVLVVLIRLQDVHAGCRFSPIGLRYLCYDVGTNCELAASGGRMW